MQTQTVQVQANAQQGDYCAEMKLMGVIPIKTAQVKTQERQYVIAGGTPFGVKLYTDGVIVVGMTDVDAEGGAVNPARLAGIREGDAIISISGCRVNTTEDVAKAFEDCDGNPIDVEIQRGRDIFMLKFSPALSASQKMYKAGLWVRDSSAGIGTMTFYNPQNGVFGGLGHGICDVDTGELMPLMSGAAVAVSITGCTPGRNGAPGELCGYFHNEKVIGSLKINGETGVYGEANEPHPVGEELPVAMKQEISEGAAEIITTLDDSDRRDMKLRFSKFIITAGHSKKTW